MEDKYNEKFIKYSEGDTTMYVPESNTAIGVTVTEQEGYLFDDYVEQKTQYELKNDLLNKMQNDCVISSNYRNHCSLFRKPYNRQLSGFFCRYILQN